LGRWFLQVGFQPDLQKTLRRKRRGIKPKEIKTAESTKKIMPTGRVQTRKILNGYLL
jgi:hypothetical protein